MNNTVALSYPHSLKNGLGLPGWRLKGESSVSLETALFGEKRKGMQGAVVLVWPPLY